MVCEGVGGGLCVCDGCGVWVCVRGSSCLFSGVQDEEKAVRNAALFAIGQFSEHLQVPISLSHTHSGNHIISPPCSIARDI